MFGKFGGIVIIALSVVIIAGLVLRSTSEHPAALSLGITDGKVATQSTPAKEDAIEATTDTAKDAVQEVKTSIEETAKTASEALDTTKDAVTEKAEALKSKAVEAIKETISSTVESTDEVMDVVKETVETKSN